MKVIWITVTIGLLTVIAALAQENEDYDYEDEMPIVSQPVQRSRTPLLSVRQPKIIPLNGNNNNNNNNNNKIKTAGGKTSSGAKQLAPPKPPGPVQEEQDEYQEDYDQAAEEPVEITSTEAPKKTIKPIVRPFRSNDDLLAALKRRRQQVQNSGAVVDKTSTTTSSTTASPSNSHKKGSSSYNSGRRSRVSTGGNRNTQVSQASESVPAETEPIKKSPQSRRYSSRNGNRTPQPVEDEKPLEEQQQSQVKPKFGRGSRKLVS